MDIIFRKRDFWLAIFAGELVAWLAFPTLKNLKILDLLAGRGIGLGSFIFFWSLFIPVGAIFGLWIFYFISEKTGKIGFFEMGKYGVIGVLNTLLNAGIFNLLIVITAVTAGLTLDLFLIIAFAITVVNSYFWNKYWAFESTSAQIGGEATRFFAVSAVVALVNAGILHLIVNIIGAPQGVDLKIWDNFGLAVTIITAFFGNFFGYKFLVFKK